MAIPDRYPAPLARAIRHPGAHLDQQSKAPACGRRVAISRPTTSACRRAAGRVRRPARQHERHRARHLGIWTPPRPACTADWPAAGRSASESAS